MNRFSGKTGAVAGFLSQSGHKARRFHKEQKCSFPVFCPGIPVLWFPFAGQIRPDPEEGGFLRTHPSFAGVMVTGQHGSYEGMGLAE
jgi:hypothetical protein